MSTTLNKLRQLKRAHRKQRKASGNEQIFVHFEGDDFGTCNGKRISLTDWEKLKSENDTEINVLYNKSEPTQGEQDIKLQWPEEVGRM